MPLLLSLSKRQDMDQAGPDLDLAVCSVYWLNFRMHFLISILRFLSRSYNSHLGHLDFYMVPKNISQVPNVCVKYEQRAHELTTDVNLRPLRRRRYHTYTQSSTPHTSHTLTHYILIHAMRVLWRVLETP